MDANVSKTIERMNVLRKQYSQLGWGVVLLCVVPIPIVFMTPMICSLTNHADSTMPMSVVAFIIYMGAVIIGCKIMGPKQKEVSDELQRLYKGTFMNGILEQYFDDVYYRWQTGISQQQFFDTGIYKEDRITEYHSEDYLSGVYQGVPFKQSDVVVKKLKKVGSETRTISLFSGRLFEFDYSFKAVESVKIYPTLVVNDSDRFEIDKNNIIKMESENFNETFTVASANQEDAFYVITPPVMEQLIKLNNKYKKTTMNDGSAANIEGLYRTIALHFKQNKLYVAINNMNSFDTNFLKEINYEEEQEKIKKHIQVIIDIMEILKLID